MKKFLSIVLALIISSCVDTTDHGLNGDFLLQLENESCNIVLSFHGDDYVYQFACSLEDGTLGIETEVGTFGLRDDAIHFQPAHSTCATDDGSPFEYGIDRDKDGITLYDDEGIMRLERFNFTPSSTSLYAVFGCYDDEGRFTTMPLTSTQ
jgi:hypothetical protein